MCRCEIHLFSQYKFAIATGEEGSRPGRSVGDTGPVRSLERRLAADSLGHVVTLNSPMGTSLSTDCANKYLPVLFITGFVPPSLLSMRSTATSAGISPEPLSHIKCHRVWLAASRRTPPSSRAGHPTARTASACAHAHSFGGAEKRMLLQRDLPCRY